MAILCQNTISLSYLSSSFPLRKVYHRSPRRPSFSCPECINQEELLPWWKNISTPADWRKPIGRGFLSRGCRATDSKKRPSVSGSENSEDQDAKRSESSVYEDLEEKFSNRLAGINGGLMEKEAEELQNLEEKTIADDLGRSPDDYNRRALLFDKNAQIFTSLIHKDDNDQQDTLE